VQVLRDADATPATGPHVVTIGNYDGVHVGHRSVIELTNRRAAERGIGSAVVTFDPHPASVVRPDAVPLLLTDLDQKLDLLANAEVDTTFVVHFDEARAQETAEDFIRSVLVDRLSAAEIIVGNDFHFGKGRTGNVDALTEMGSRLGFAVEGVALLPQAAGSTAVSSTAIRRALVDGDVVTAARLLGRDHEVRGPVAPGDQRGRTIGFPTANVAVARNRALPGDGVYAAWYVRPDGSTHPAAVNIGRRPTFYDNAEHSLVEAHLLDFSGDLYNEQARVQFVARLRPEQRFDGIDALQAQLAADIAQAAEVLARATQPPA
jgi:riboflavin kinase/FMN adenylyltransferase